MKIHLVLLRGINVSGHNLIKMEALQKALESIGFEGVSTYIQSGNVFVKTLETNSIAVGFQIKNEIFKVFGHEVPTLVIDKNDLLSCLSNNPFLKEKEADTKKLYVAFLSARLKEDAIHDLKMSAVKPDEVHIDNNRLYIKYFISPGKTRLDQNYIEKKLNVVATIRNWNSILNLLEIYESFEV